MWDPDNDDEVEAARKQFEELVDKKGFSAFEVGARGKKTTRRVDNFDPDLGSLILVPVIQGG
jgi:hypothetical protein